jgi:hypothetical protein
MIECQLHPLNAMTQLSFQRLLALQQETTGTKDNMVIFITKDHAYTGQDIPTIDVT